MFASLFAVINGRLSDSPALSLAVAVFSVLSIFNDTAQSRNQNSIEFCATANMGFRGPHPVAGGLPVTVRHVYPDGFIERACTIVIRDGRAQGEYFIGLNERTAIRWLERFEKQRDKQEIETKKNPAESDGGTAKGGQSNGTQSKGHQGPTDGVPRTEGEKKHREHRRAKGLKTNEENVDDRDGAKGGPVVPGTAEGEGEHLTDSRIIEQYSTLSGVWFDGALKLSIDGKRVALENVKVTSDARHPFSMLVRFEFPVEIDGAKLEAEQGEPNGSKPVSLSLEIVDRTFVKAEAEGQLGAEERSKGAVRYALRTKGGTMLAQSNVAPVLARSDRIELETLNSESRAAAMSIKAKVLVSLK